ncbi:MAG TPA: AAA family ATPase [Phycisphaerales bacterium]|nr:AAA family ATPase [Phycisphaerales bacterium]
MLDLRKPLESGNTLVRLVTHEEPEVLDIALGAASQLRVQAWVWSSTGGLRQAELRNQQPIADTMDPAAALVWLRVNIRQPAMCIFLDLSDHLHEPRAVRALRDLVEHFRAGGENMELRDRAWLVMIDYKSEVPGVVDTLSRRLDIPPPDDEEVEQIVRQVVQRVSARRPLAVRVPKRTFEAMVQGLRGLSRRQVQQVVSEVVSADGEFNEHDLPGIIEGKRRLIRAAGVLDFVERPASMEDVGGMSALKEWLRVRQVGMDGEGSSAGLEPPRGILLLGVQGAGKSLAAKAIATAWQRPLMRLDPGMLYDRYVGESERRLRDALRQAEAMAPVVLWIDEIEKGFASAASQSTDGGLSQRMFGTFLSWMQERQAPVFIVATANNIEALPPELLRKGRFDEIFFVDLPGAAARRQIFSVHLRKRRQDAAQFDLARLVQESEGYSGGEIEQAILSGMYTAFAAKRGLTTDDISSAMTGSPPLSITMRERIGALRAWASGRCVPAD